MPTENYTKYLNGNQIKKRHELLGNKNNNKGAGHE